MVHNRCKGCKVKENICSFILMNRIDKCPCIECLVKPMCIQSCDLRQEIKNITTLVLNGDNKE